MRQNLALLLVTIFLGAVVMAAEDNPLSRAKVGDWAEYTLSVPGQDQLMTQVHKVIKKTDTNVVIESTMKPGKLPESQLNELPVDVRNGQTTVVTIPLAMPANQDAVQTKGNVQSKEIGRGEEALEIGGKKIATTWIETQATYIEQDKPVTSKIKVWTSPDVPLGLVKQQISTPEGQSTMLLTKFGSGGA